MKIRTKLILIYLLGALLTSVTSFFAIRSYRSIEKNYDIVMNDPVKKIEALRLIEQSGLRIIASTSEYILLEAEKNEQEFEDKKDKSNTKTLSSESNKSADSEEQELENFGQKKYSEAFANYKNLVVVSAETDGDFLTEIESAGKGLLATSEEIVNLKKKGVSGKQILEKKDKFEVDEQKFLKAIEKSIEHQDTELAAKQTEVTETIQQSSRNTILVTLLAFALAVLGGFTLSNSISRPLVQLQAASRKIGRGDLNTVISINSKDEIGELAADFQQMALRLKSSHYEILNNKNLVENILNSMADLLITVEDDGTIQSVNLATLFLLGYEEDEIVGKPISLLTKNESFLTKDEFERLLEFKKLLEVEKDFFSKDGEKISVSVSASVLQGKKTAAVVVAKDISKRLEDDRKLRQYATKLEQSNRELEDFAYVASHDLQEPLRKVQAFGDRLQRKCADSLNEEGNDYIRRMRDAAGRMQNLINDLLTFSRVSSKAQPFQHVDINKITKEVVSDLEIRIEQTGGIVEIGNLPTIEADPVQMRQLLQNLIGNALKFHRPDDNPVIKIYSDAPSMTGGSLLIDGKEIQTIGNSNQVCKIIIRDNGIGFEEKYLDKIFTVFQRLHGRGEYEGSGIGLAVCRKIVERHGGTITAQSEPNQGATFLVTLPLAQTDMEINTNEKRF